MVLIIRQKTGDTFDLVVDTPKGAVPFPYKKTIGKRKASATLVRSMKAGGDFSPLQS